MLTARSPSTGGAVLTLKNVDSFGFIEESVVSVGNGSKVILKSAGIVGCLLTSQGSGKFIVKGQCDVPSEDRATTVVRAGASLSGDFSLGGVTRLAKAGGAELIVEVAGFISGAVTLHGGDAIIVDVNATRRLFLRNESTGTIAGAGQIGEGDTPTGKMLLLNEGVIDARGRGLLTIDTGRRAIVNSGTIEATERGRGKVRSAVQNDGVLMAEGGSLLVNRAVTGSGSGAIDGGTLAFGSTFSQDVAFTGASGVLKLARSRGYAGAVLGLSKTGGTSFDLLDIGFTGAGEATFSGNHNAGVLTVSDGTHTAHITLAGDYTGVTFVASSDGHGGVSIVDASAPAAAPVHALVAAMAAMPSAGAPAAAIDAAHGPPWRPMLAAAGHAHTA